MNAVEARRKVIVAWRQIATAERRTAWSLLRRGFLYRREPALIQEGKKPDYLTFGRGRMWVEVKALDPPPSQALLNEAWRDIEPRLAAISGPCRVDAQVSGVYEQRAAEVAIWILKRQLVRVSEGDVFFVGIPRDPMEKSLVTLEWNADSGNVRMFSPRSKSGMYGYPSWAAPANWLAPLTIRDGQSVAEVRAHEVFHGREPCVVMLRVERESTYGGLRSISGAEAQNVTTVERLRQRIQDASVQLRNGQKYLPVPGVVNVYADHLGADHSELFRACLGDITISIDRSTLKADAPFHGQNGVMRPNKNRPVSAVTYSSRQFPTISLLNPYAAVPIAAPWLAGTVYHVIASGEVVARR